MSCITGDETGIVKIWDITKSSGATLKFSFGDQSRTNGISSLCWLNSSTREVCINRKNGVVEVFNMNLKQLSCKKNLGEDAVAACSNGISVLRSKMVVVQRDGQIRVVPLEATRPEEVLDFCESDETEGEKTKTGARKKKTGGLEGCAEPREVLLEDETRFVTGRGPVDACHIHRRSALVAMAGKENDLQIFDIAGERTEPVFTAQNVRDHVLDIVMPVYVVGACIVSSNVSCVATAHHQVRFYDRRASARPVQEFSIAREVERRPTCLMQWNCNKFLIGETSGDVHLYDTRRGFTSRAKLRGGVGSVRSMAKHPEGHQILAVAGLDRKTRLFHVPTGKTLMSIYLKQRGTSVLLDKGFPLSDNVAAFSGMTDSKNPAKSGTLGDEIWDDMDPVIDEFEDVVVGKQGNNSKRKRN